MLERTITALILIPIIIFCVLFESNTYGIIPYFIMVLTVVMLSTTEFYHMAQNKNIKIHSNIGITIAIILISLAFFKESNYFWSNKYFHIFSMAVVILFIIEFFRKKFIIPSSSFTTTIRGILYLSLPLSFLFPIRNLTTGKYFLFFLIFGIVLNDICAFLVRKKWGKTRLSSLSPKKTLEGYLAGFIASFIIIYLGLNKIGLHAVILGIITGFIAPLGDLLESFLKRSFNVKDAGNILPGHGGMLDRIDSFILLIPLYYFYLFWIIKLRPL